MAHLIPEWKRKKSLYNNYDIDKLYDLVNVMSEERADSYHSWIAVGWALHNVNPSDVELLKVWIQFSKKSAKFKEGECEGLWGKFRDTGYTIGSIYYWAKQDNKSRQKN